MIAWSRGLGKRELIFDFNKCNVIREGDKLYLKGKLHPTLWDCRVTFVKEDFPGLLAFLLSFAVLSHFARNILGILKFVPDKFIFRRMGMKPTEKKPGEKASGS